MLKPDSRMCTNVHTLGPNEWPEELLETIRLIPRLAESVLHKLFYGCSILCAALRGGKKQMNTSTWFRQLRAVGKDSCLTQEPVHHGFNYDYFWVGLFTKKTPCACHWTQTMRQPLSLCPFPERPQECIWRGDIGRPGTARTEEEPPVCAAMNVLSQPLLQSWCQCHTKSNVEIKLKIPIVPVFLFFLQ